MRFKSILAAFTFIILASFIAFIVFIQTKSFGNLVTRVVSDIAQRKTQSKIKMKSLSLSVFPPGIELNKVSFKKKMSDVENFEAEFGKIGLYISLLEIEERRLTLGEIRIEDSSIQYDFPKSDSELKEIDKSIINKIFEISDRSPVGIDTLIIENSRIHANHDLLEARRLKLFKKQDSFVARFHLANIKPLADNDFKLDEIWGDAEISKNNIKLERLKVQHDVQSILVKGKVKNYRLLKNAQIELNGEGYFHLESLKNLVTFPELIKIKKGFAKLGFNTKYTDQKVGLKGNLLLENFDSNLFYAEELRSSFEFTDNKVTVSSLDLKYHNERVHLISPVLLADINKKSYLAQPIVGSVENLSLNNALSILGPSLKPLKGQLSGQIVVEYKKGDLYFRPQNNFKINNLGLVVGKKEKPFTVVMVKEAKLSNSEFSLIKNEFQMSALVELARSKLEVDGFINKKEVRFIVPDSQINLEDLGNIANLDVKGEGSLSVNVSGSLDNTVINLKGKTKGFEILGYHLGEADKNITIELKESNVIINKMEGLVGKTHLSGTGHVNYDEGDIALGINSNDATSTDLFQILGPIMSKVDFLPEDFDLRARLDVSIFGKYRLPELKIKTKVDFTDFTAYGEHLTEGSFNVSLLNEVLSIGNLKAQRGDGSLSGNFVFNLNDKKMAASYNWDGLSLSGFNHFKNLRLNFDGNSSGSFVGSGTTSNYHFKLDTHIDSTKSPTNEFEDSDVHLDIFTDRIAGKAGLFGDMLVTSFSYSLSSPQRSFIKLNLDSDDIKPLTVATFGQQLENEDFTGKAHVAIDTSFDKNLENLDLSAYFQEFSFTHANFNVNYLSSHPQFVVKKNIIRNWDMNIKQPDFTLSSSGEGVFGKKVSLEHNLRFNSKIFEVIIPQLMSSEGFIEGSLKVEEINHDYNFSVLSKTDDLSLSLDLLPIPLNNLKYNIEYASRRLSVHKLETTLESGTVGLKGDIFFDGNVPDVNLKYVLDKAEIPILGKSSINISGEGIILGNNLPYSVGGEVIVNRAQIVNELSDFSSKSATLSQVRFLPKNQESILGKLFNLNVNVKAENLIRITNSLMDVGLRGEVRILGNPARPKGEGRVTSPQNTSRIFFKNNEYLITTADINFNPKKEISNPDFDVQALTYISNYKVYPKAYGDVARFNFDLTSDPPLPRNSILSLIAFGYSDEMQNSLSTAQQQNLNQLGVGSFVFDQFKISDILNKQFGLQVNLGTYFEQSQTDSLLAGRSQDGYSGNSGIGRTRSATKIELKKRLDEAVSISVSSTMGGGIGQRQRMNLNYGLAKKVQLEGVYELRTNADGEEDIIDNSIGADVKFRWTFK